MADTSDEIGVVASAQPLAEPVDATDVHSVTAGNLQKAKQPLGRDRKVSSTKQARVLRKQSESAVAVSTTTPSSTKPVKNLIQSQVPGRSAPASQSSAASSPAFSIKDLNMDMSANFSGFQDAIGQAQAKAQAAFEKSSAMFGEAGDFAKGNVEALIESGKILSEGVQEISSTFVNEGRTAFETMTGDFKELAAAKSPADFFKLQGELARKSVDSAVACSSKNTETFFKLMNDAFSPISDRVNLAVEKARHVSPLSTGWNKAA